MTGRANYCNYPKRYFWGIVPICRRTVEWRM